MKVILTTNIKKIGKIGDTVSVKPGFARNFLFPNKMALRENKKNAEYYDKIKDEMDKINKSIKILKHAISLNTSDEIKDAIINLETVCEFYVERRMNNSIKSLITGKDINDII